MDEEIKVFNTIYLGHSSTFKLDLAFVAPFDFCNIFINITALFR